MHERQPLLESTENTSSANNVFHRGRKIINRYLSWRDWFGLKQTIKDYKSDGDNKQDINKRSYIKFIHIVRENKITRCFISKYSFLVSFRRL